MNVITTPLADVCTLINLVSIKRRIVKVKLIPTRDCRDSKELGGSGLMPERRTNSHGRWNMGRDGIKLKSVDTRCIWDLNGRNCAVIKRSLMLVNSLKRGRKR